MFSEQGIRAVGVEAIVAAADTAKTTLYAHFGSKDALVVAYLQRRGAQRRERLERALTTHRGSPVDQVLHLYDLLAVEVAVVDAGDVVVESGRGQRLIVIEGRRLVARWGSSLA